MRLDVAWTRVQQQAQESHRYEASLKLVLDGKQIFRSFDAHQSLVLPAAPQLLTRETQVQARAALRLEQIRERCVPARSCEEPARATGPSLIQFLAAACSHVHPSWAPW
jgi:hypothetical protein